MLSQRAKRFSRIGFVLIIIFSGLALLPFSPLSAEKLTWQRFAGIYQPDLDVIGEDDGAPGSAFLFSGDSFPMDATATVFFGDDQVGTVTTTTGGDFQFQLQTTAVTPPGQYIVTVIGEGASASTTITLGDALPLRDPVDGFAGPTFVTGHLIYLPSVLGN